MNDNRNDSRKEEYDDGFGPEFVTIEDDDGREFELEYLDTLDYKDATYHAYLPADMDENDPEYGIIILRSYFDENNEELLESVDDDALLDEIYDQFMILFNEDEEADAEQ